MINPEDCISVNIKNYIDEKVQDTRTLIETRFQELTHRMEYRAEVTSVALKEAKNDMNIRLAGMNEFREAMKDLSASFVTRSEIENIKDQIKLHITRSEYDALILRIEALNSLAGGFTKETEFHALKEKYDAIKNQQIVMLIAIVLALVAVVFDLIVRIRV